MTGRFRDPHAFEDEDAPQLIDAINEEIAGTDEAMGSNRRLPRRRAVLHRLRSERRRARPRCADASTTPLSLAGRLDGITRIGKSNARVVIAELGTDRRSSPPGRATAWARLTPRTMQPGETHRPGRTGKGNRYIRGALGQAAMTAAKTDTRLGAMYRRIARKRGEQKAIVAVYRVICEIAWMLHLRARRPLRRLGADSRPRSPALRPAQNPRHRAPQPRQESHSRRRRPRSRRVA